MDYKVGLTVIAIGADVHQAVTKPPENYTDGTLIAAMTNIHKFVTDPKDRQILKDAKGLGTERTRGAIIEGLIQRKYLKRGVKGRLIATKHYRAILDMLPPSLKDPVLTAKWEEALARIERGETTLEQFMAKIEAFTRELVEHAKALDGKVKLPPPDEDEPVCPTCGSGNLRRKKGSNGFFWACTCFPFCKSTLPEKNGKPDFAARR
jgi:DNA topoisomerase-3